MATIKLEKLNKVMRGGDEKKYALITPDKRIVPMMAKKTPVSKKAPFSIKDLDLEIPDGKVMVVLGPSGCGKTTLLRLIAGVLNRDSGRITYDGVDLADIPREKLCIGMVFQNYALYPHFTSRQNIISYYFLKRKTPVLTKLSEEKLKRTSELMDVSIDYLLERKPDRLSGGERQRVAVGRCITRDPSLFLLDEPFSNLDQILRQKYRLHLKTLLREFGITTVHVTHDQQEALILADLIAVMREGRIEQSGTFEQIYNNPENLFVAEFLNPGVDCPAVNLMSGESVSFEHHGKLIGVRPQDIRLSGSRRDDFMSATVTSIAPTPFKTDKIVEIKFQDRKLVACIPADEAAGIETGAVWMGFPKYHVFDTLTGKRLETVRKELWKKAIAR